MPAHALLAAVALLLSAAVPAAAHDVVWPGKPTGASPPVPIFLAPFASAEIAVRPEVGEPCIVGVTLNPFLPDGFIAQVATDNPALEVKVRVFSSVLPYGGIVTATV